MSYYITVFAVLVVGFSIIALLFNEEPNSSEYQQEPSDTLEFLNWQKNKKR